MNAYRKTVPDNNDTVSTSELRRAFGILVDHLEKQGIASITLEHDYYWSIPENELYDPKIEPQTMSIGQLSEDLAFLQSILQDCAEPTGYGFILLSSILRAVGGQHPY